MRTNAPRCRRLTFVLVTLLALMAAGCRSTTLPQATPVEAGTSFRTPAAKTIPAPRPGIAKRNDTAEAGLKDNLWDRIRAGFRLDLTDNDRIAAQRNWYTRNQAYLDRVTARASRYLYHIVEEAEARDMPLELALLPIVESAFDPYAYSVAHAAGPWQFIPSTGQVFGLRQDWWWDGRRDILLSTNAALSYLSQLASRFDGDYLKALASYNAGGGTVSRAVKRNLQSGKDTNYWALKLPQETLAYVPKLIALAQIVQDPGKYGVRLNPIPDEPVFSAIAIDRQIDLGLVAELAGMPVAELYLYNPGHNRWATDPAGPHRLVMPVDNAARFREALARVPADQYLRTITHTLAESDSLESLASANGISVDVIRMSNPGTSAAASPGTVIRIPLAHLPHRIQGDTYEPRMVAASGRSATAVATTKKYTVRKGDSLGAVARKHRVNVRDLAKWNGLKSSAGLRTGQVLKIRTVETARQPAGASPARKATASASGNSRGTASRDNQRHTVRKGETLHGLARKFSVSVHDIARWNDFGIKRQLRAGEVLKIFID